MILLSRLSKYSILTTALIFLASPVQAEWLSTQQILSAKQQPIQHIKHSLQREEVQRALAEHGVDAKLVQQHLASMTDNEISILNERLRDAPAGGDGGTAVTVLVILALLEILGITDLFTFM